MAKGKPRKPSKVTNVVSKIVKPPLAFKIGFGPMGGIKFVESQGIPNESEVSKIHKFNKQRKTLRKARKRIEKRKEHKKRSAAAKKGAATRLAKKYPGLTAAEIKEKIRLERNRKAQEKRDYDRAQRRKANRIEMGYASDEV